MSFRNRRTLHGRIVHVVKSKEEDTTIWATMSNKNIDNSKEQPIVLLMYHLSPIQRLLNRSAFNLFTYRSLTGNSLGRIDERDDILRIEIGARFSTAVADLFSKKLLASKRCQHILFNFSAHNRSIPPVKISSRSKASSSI